MGKDPHRDAEKELNKAELYFDNENYKKAGKSFKSAGDSYFKLREFKIARECYSYAAKAYDFENRSDITIEALRSAGDSSLFIDDFSTSNKFFKNTIRFIPDLYKVENRNLYYLFFSTLSYLCLFLEGKQDQGLEFIKEIRKDVESDYFKDSPYIGLIKDLTIAIRDKNEKYLKKIEQDFSKYDFSQAEQKLLKTVLALANANISLKTNMSLDKDQYTTRDIISLTLNLDSTPIIDVSKYSFYEYTFKKVKITNITVSLSDNITPQTKPELPIILNPGENIDFIFTFKPHFQVADPFIGPFVITCELDDKFLVYHKDAEIIKPNIVSPPPSLEVSMKNLRPPLIDKSFPMEFLIENKSEGDALELQVEIEFPEQLKVMRGTIKKQIYSLSSNDTITWEISLKPTEPGDYIINMDIKFKDPDQNLIEDTKSFPFAIKM
jgi:tetratricopeptide (TPR) repeat protein